VMAIPNLSPTQARELIRDVMFGPKAGVALQVAALRLIGDLQIPSPLELYKAAWHNGKCHRDIAGNILSKVATSPLVDWSPEDVRYFFDFFDRADREEDRAYVAGLLLDALQANPKWSLPFLPQIVGRLAMVPEATGKAINALCAAKSDPTEVMKAFAEVTSYSRLAMRAKGVVDSAPKSNKEAKLISDLSGYAPEASSFDTIVKAVKKMQLENCDPVVLQGFVRDLLLRADALQGFVRDLRGAKMTDALDVWARLLRRGDAASWAGIVGDMEQKMLVYGSLDLDRLFAQIVQARVHTLKLEGEEQAKMVTVVRDLFERLLDTRLDIGKVQLVDVQEEDAAWTAKRAEAATISSTIILKHWADLLALGCDEEELKRLFARCPKGKRAELATRVVDGAIAKAKKDKTPLSDVPFHTIKWLGSEVRDAHLTTLMKLWADVIGRATDGRTFNASLGLLGRPLPPAAKCVELVQAVLAQEGCNRSVSRAALTWLSTVSPAGAVRLWPALLTVKDGATFVEVAAGDVEALLQLCVAENIDPPPLPSARAGNAEVLKLLAMSKLPAARIMAVQVLQERHGGSDQGEADLLEKLCGDEFTVVRVAAQHLRNLVKSAKEAEPSIPA